MSWGSRDGWLVAAAFAAATLPIVLVPVPPVMDYPNHLARIWLAAGAADLPPLSSIYAIRWSQAATNVAVDFLASGLARHLDIYTVGRILLGLAFIGPPLAGALLNRAIFGRSDVWQLAFLMLAWTTTSVAGFISYQIGLAGSLLGATHVCIRLHAARPVGPLLHVLYAALLLLIHPFAVLFYVALVAALTLGERAAVPPTRAGLTLLAKRLVAPTLAASVPVLVLLLFAPSPPSADGAAGAGLVWHLPGPVLVAQTVLSPILAYDAVADVLMFAPIALVVLWSAWRGTLRVHRGLLVVGAAVLAVSPLAPAGIGDATWLERRLPLMAALMLLAAMRPTCPDPRCRRALALVLAATVAVRIGWLTTVWLARDRDVAELIAAARTIEPGAAVLTVLQETDWRTAPSGTFVMGSPGGPRPTARHLGAILVIENRVFLPSLFAVPGQHVLRYLPPWRERRADFAKVPYTATLTGARANRPCLDCWRREFGYVVLLDAHLPAKTALDPTGLAPVAGQGAARVFRVLE